MRSAPGLLLIAIVTTGLTSCSASSTRSLQAPVAIEVSMSEYRFDVISEVAPGRAVFRVRNVGRLNHEFILVPLAADYPPLSEIVASDGRRALPTLAAFKSRPPGFARVFAVDLEVGRYGLLCLLRDVDGVSFAKKGMAREIKVAD